jgi:hypothetical protein
MPYQKSSVSDPGRGKSLSGFEYCHQYSNTSGEVPTAAELKPGEIAVNAADGKIFYENNQGVVKSIPGGFTGTLTTYDTNLGQDFVLTFTNGLLISMTTP